MSETEPTFDQVQIDRKKRISSVWIVPLIALIFGGYLAVKGYMERGVFIVVNFDTAAGIIPGKTEVRYKGLPAGLVKSVQLNDDLQTVNVEIEMVKRTKSLLTTEAAFWLVQPEISLSGVSGLETITGGNYIGFRPGLKENGKLVDEYVALKSPPPIPKSTPGLHIVLTSENKGSIQIGTKVYYRQIAVGEVTSLGLNELNKGVKFEVHIKEEHADLVSNHSRFWNASGITLSGGLSGFKFRTESVEALLVGGIAFDNIDTTTMVTNTGFNPEFVLYEDFEAAQVGLPITLRLPFGAGIREGTEIRYEGLKAGKVTSYTVDIESRTIIAKATIDPRAEKALNDNTIFYLVAPKASLAGIANLETIITGRFISIRPSFEGRPVTEFEVLREAPPLDYDLPGLHINLLSEFAQGLSHGDPISFRKIQVGTIQQVKYSDELQKFVVAAHIEPDYVHLVSANTRFWQAGGLRVKGNIQNFAIETDSLLSLISGGVAFDIVGQPVDTGIAVENGAEFTLFLDQEDALFRHAIQISFPTKEGLVEGVTPVKYNGVVIGRVRTISTDHSLRRVTASVGINPRFGWILREKTQFWLVTPSLSKEGLEAILSGGFITLVPGEGKFTDRFKANLNPPVYEPESPGLQIVIRSEQAGSLVRGSGIYYQQLKVGEIQGVQLDKAREGVEIFAHIEEQYSDLVKTGSRFYQVSGLFLKGDLTGFKVRTESLATMLNGGIAFYTPPDVKQETAATDQTTFELFDDLEAAKLASINIRIRFNSAQGLRINMPIKYQDQKIGEVTHIEFADDLNYVTVQAALNRNAAAYARTESKFWLVKPQVGLSEIRNVETIVTGTYLAAEPGGGQPAYDYIGLEEPPVIKSVRSGLNLVLTSDRLGSLKIGDPVSYRQIRVGEIIGFDIAPDGNGVIVYANVYQRYSPLVKNDTVFWMSSGIRVDAGLFSGVEINTESIESLLSGGIAFATPGATQGQLQAEHGMRFRLHDEVNEEWLIWKPSIRLAE